MNHCASADPPINLTKATAVFSKPWRTSAAQVIIGLTVLLFVFGTSLRAKSPNPAFPVGTIAVSPYITGDGTNAVVEWSVTLPDNENPANFVHFIRQVQMPSGVSWDIPVEQAGEMQSGLQLDTSGSRFELWIVRVDPLEVYLLNSTFIGVCPTASVTIRSEDPYSILPRTRADRPFYVDVTVQGISNDEGLPESSKAVNLFRFAQSYGTDGTGVGLDRTVATLISQSTITDNGTQTFTYSLSSVPGSDPMTLRGEERFSVYSLEGDVTPPSQIASQSIQIWPVATGNISGIANGQIIGPSMPDLTLVLNDLYPDSCTWTQVYKGGPKLAATGTVVPDSYVVLNSPIPENCIIQLSDYDQVFDSDGLWTMEILTKTPFGTERLACVSFTIQGLGMTLEGWRQTHFGNTGNSGDGSDLNDFDRDGLPNLVEFAFGQDPKHNSAGSLPVPQIIGSNQVISFTQPSDIKGVTYGAEWSETLRPDDWSPITDTGEPPQHSFSVPTGSRSQIFLRLKVSAP
jgi:hypothetical protein